MKGVKTMLSTQAKALKDSLLNEIMQKIREIIKTQGYIDIASFKKHFNISRKYIIAYLDYLDNYGDIKKEDNKRMLR